MPWNITRSNEANRGKYVKKVYVVVCLIAVLIVGAYIAWDRFGRDDAPPPLNVSESSQAVESQAEVEADPELTSEPEVEPAPLLYTVGKFGPDDLRMEYVSEEMILKIPRISFEGPVYSDIEDITPGSLSYQGVSSDVLLNGVALFGAAQVPTNSNSNVSIAGHRDIYGMEFYYIDRITEGDYMFLEFRCKEYVYLFEDSFVTEDNDWDPIKTKDYGCITLQSCTPIHVASHRIFVVGRLVEIRELSENATVE